MMWNFSFHIVLMSPPFLSYLTCLPSLLSLYWLGMPDFPIFFGGSSKKILWESNKIEFCPHRPYYSKPNRMLLVLLNCFFSIHKVKHSKENIMFYVTFKLPIFHILCLHSWIPTHYITYFAFTQKLQRSWYVRMTSYNNKVCSVQLFRIQKRQTTKA